MKHLRYVEVSKGKKEPSKKTELMLLFYICLIFGEGNGNPLQYSCLENPMDRGAWWATVHWVANTQTRLSD